MEKNITVQDKKKQIIDAIQPTDEHLTSRAGLALFAQYLQNIRLMPIIERMFASMRKNKKRINAHSILGSYHGRGKDELANRALKNFGHQQLPFKDFISNTACYYLMLLGNNLFEAFKEDVSKPVIAVTMYADSFRRQFLDTAGKLLRHAGKLILKIPKTTFERLQLDQLFATCQHALTPI